MTAVNEMRSVAYAVAYIVGKKHEVLRATTSFLMKVIN